MRLNIKTAHLLSLIFAHITKAFCFGLVTRYVLHGNPQSKNIFIAEYLLIVLSVYSDLYSFSNPRANSCFKAMPVHRYRIRSSQSTRDLP